LISVVHIADAFVMDDIDNALHRLADNGNYGIPGAIPTNPASLSAPYLPSLMQIPQYSFPSHFPMAMPPQMTMTNTSRLPAKPTLSNIAYSTQESLKLQHQQQLQYLHHSRPMQLQPHAQELSRQQQEMHRLQQQQQQHNSQEIKSTGNEGNGDADDQKEEEQEEMTASPSKPADAVMSIVGNRVFSIPSIGALSLKKNASSASPLFSADASLRRGFSVGGYSLGHRGRRKLQNQSLKRAITTFEPAYQGHTAHRQALKRNNRKRIPISAQSQASLFAPNKISQKDVIVNSNVRKMMSQVALSRRRSLSLSALSSVKE